MVRRCGERDVPAIESIINDAAERYRGVIPDDCFHHPYMARRDLESEIAAGVQFWGWEDRHHGFRLVPVDERDRLLSAYWTIPDRQREASVVLVRAETASQLPTTSFSS